MKSQLTEKHFNDFWIRLYFDVSEGYKIAAIKRAYRDFNRTLESFPKCQAERTSCRNNWKVVLLTKLEELVTIEFIDQEEFTLWHQSTCYKMRKANQFELSQGQAQKWINMTLKYLFAFGEDKVPGISLNYKFFHVPIDNIIMTEFEKFGIPKFRIPWSKIPDYDSYHKYQIQIREVFSNRIPMDVEFELFNGVTPANSKHKK
jgi:hypothetical protein